MTVRWLIDRLKNEDPNAVIIRPNMKSLEETKTHLKYDLMFPPELGIRFFNLRSRRVRDKAVGRKKEIPAVVFLT